MKCLFFLLFLNFCGFLSHVASLTISVPPNVVAGQPTTVTWTREPTDPQELNFDLRFVQEGFKDVGLAIANIYPDGAVQTGQLTVRFPRAGAYMLVAVTGSPSYEHIGSSNEVEAGSATTSSNTPSSTSTLPTSSATQPPVPVPTTNTSPVSGTPRSANLPAILGGVIGSILLVTLLVAALIFAQRRRKAVQHRISFHKDMMVQRRSPEITLAFGPPHSGTIIQYPFTTSPTTVQPPPPAAFRPRSQMSDDIESMYSAPSPIAASYPSGMSGILLPPGHASTYLGTGHIIPPPIGPRERPDPIRRDLTKTVQFRPALLPPIPAVSPILTPRQKEIVDRMAQLRTQMNELKDQIRPSSIYSDDSDGAFAGSSGSLDNKMAVLEDMQKQMLWLTEAKESKWALGQSDIRPAGFSRYMTP